MYRLLALAAIPVALAGCLCFLAMGFAIGSVVSNPETGDAVSNVITNPMMFLSGVFFPVAAMPANGDVSGPFQRPQIAQFGSGRNAFTGPRFFNSDFSLFKNFAITERFGAQFRFEAFNVFNHVNLNNPNNCIDCSGSGLITSLAPNAQMRQLNFGMKVTF